MVFKWFFNLGDKASLKVIPFRSRNFFKKWLKGRPLAREAAMHEYYPCRPNQAGVIDPTSHAYVREAATSHGERARGCDLSVRLSLHFARRVRIKLTIYVRVFVIGLFGFER